MKLKQIKNLCFSLTFTFYVRAYFHYLYYQSFDSSIYLPINIQTLYKLVLLMASKHKWSEEEEQTLKNLANLVNPRKWVTIAEQMNALYPQRQRTSKQCREKFINHVQYAEGNAAMSWSSQEEATLFKEYLQKGSQWKLLSTIITGKSENTIKNKFYGKIRKLVRKLNNICRQRINRSNKPIRDESIMRIIDTKEGFQNLPESLTVESNEIKNELLMLAQKQMSQFESWNLLEQNNVVSLIRQIHKFNIKSRYYCSRKKKGTCSKKVVKLGGVEKKEGKLESKQVWSGQEKDILNPISQVEFEPFKLIPIIPIIIAGDGVLGYWHV